MGKYEDLQKVLNGTAKTVKKSDVKKAVYWLLNASDTERQTVLRNLVNADKANGTWSE